MLECSSGWGSRPRPPTANGPRSHGTRTSEDVFLFCKRISSRKIWLSGLFRQSNKRSAAAQLRPTSILMPFYSTSSIHSPRFNIAITQQLRKLGYRVRGMLSERSAQRGSRDESTEIDVRGQCQIDGRHQRKQMCTEVTQVSLFSQKHQNQENG